jgi:uncharacterized Zn finger protein
MPREGAMVKARRLLSEGRVALLRLDGRSVDAIVRGDAGEFYRVSHRPGSWSCSCPALSTACSHTRAVMLVTHSGSAATAGARSRRSPTSGVIHPSRTGNERASLRCMETAGG